MQQEQVTKKDVGAPGLKHPAERASLVQVRRQTKQRDEESTPEGNESAIPHTRHKKEDKQKLSNKNTEHRWTRRTNPFAMMMSGLETGHHRTAVPVKRYGCIDQGVKDADTKTSELHSNSTQPTLLNVEGENTDARTHNQLLFFPNALLKRGACRYSASIHLNKTPRRGPKTFTLKVDRDAWNVGNENPESRGA